MNEMGTPGMLATIELIVFMWVTSVGGYFLFMRLFHSGTRGA